MKIVVLASEDIYLFQREQNKKTTKAIMARNYYKKYENIYKLITAINNKCQNNCCCIFNAAVFVCWTGDTQQCLP